MRSLAAIPLLCGCAAAVEPSRSVGNASAGPPRASKLDQLAFLDGCWQARTRIGSYRFCWLREHDRFHGSLTVHPRPRGPAQVTHYFISESTGGLVLDYALSGRPERVRVSRVESQAIEFRRPDTPERRWRGADLALRYDASNDELLVSFFDVLDAFDRDR